MSAPLLTDEKRRALAAECGFDSVQDGLDPTITSLCIAIEFTTRAPLLAEIERLTAERDAAMADAERYRWLRNASLWPSKDFEFKAGLCVDLWGDDGCGQQLTGNGLDAAIDAARSAT